MTVAMPAPSAGAARPWRAQVSPLACRSILVFITVGAGLAGFLADGPMIAAHAAINAGPDLTRLLRAMAALKTIMALGLATAVLWRMGVGATLPWLGAYALACGAMAAGPGLIWTMAHVGVGALLLHAGLLGGVLLLWRDPVVGRRLAALVAARRAVIAAKS